MILGGRCWAPLGVPILWGRGPKFWREWDFTCECWRLSHALYHMSLGKCSGLGSSILKSILGTIVDVRSCLKISRDYSSRLFNCLSASNVCSQGKQWTGELRRTHTKHPPSIRAGSCEPGNCPSWSAMSESFTAWSLKLQAYS